MVTVLLALVLSQDVENERTLLEKKAAVERQLKEAVERGDLGAAQEHARESKELDTKLAGLKSAPKREWIERLNFEARGNLTHWDNDLELEDGAGWGVGAYVRDFFFFEYRRWDVEDELLDADARIQAYQLGWTKEFTVVEGTTHFVLGGSLGLVHFDSEAAGSDSDTGPIFSLSPRWKHYFSRPFRLTLGGDLDILRTDFNQRRTHTNHSFSAMAALELAF
jgi:hypothetical protein